MCKTCRKFGTPRHEQIRKQRREKHAEIIGTPKNEEIKKQKCAKYASIL